MHQVTSKGECYSACENNGMFSYVALQEASSSENTLFSASSFIKNSFKLAFENFKFVAEILQYKLEVWSLKDTGI